MENTNRKVTEAQKRSIKFCEEMLGIKYRYSIENYNAVSRFLGKNLKRAIKKKEKAEEKSKRRMMNFYERYGEVLERKKNRRG